MSMDRFSKRMDQDALPEVVVKKNSGEDLLQTIAAYAGEKDIYVPKGTYLHDVPIVTPPGTWGKLKGHSSTDTIIRANSVMATMVDTIKETTVGLQLEDICLHGGNKALLGVRCYALDQTYPYYQRNVIMRNVKVIYVDGYGLSFQNPVADALTSSADLFNITVRDCKGGIYLDYADSIIDHYFSNAHANVVVDDYLAALYIKRGGGTYSHIYPGGGFKHGIVSTADWSNFNNLRIDNLRRHGIWLIGSSYNTFDSTIIAQCGRDANNTYDALKLTGGSSHNNFAGLVAGLRTAGNKAKYGIDEEAGCNYNNYGVVCMEKDAFGTDYTLLNGTGSLCTVLRTP